MAHAKIAQCACGPDVTIVGRYDENPMLNSIVYEVEFQDRQFKEYSANSIEKTC